MKHLKRIMSYSLAMCMLILSPATTTAYNEGEDSSKSEETADYILNNLDEFSESYNSQVDQNDGDYFNPTNCEYRISISILNSDEKAVYIDFNDDNGYMVVSENEIVKFEPLGDLDYIRSFGGEIYYSITDDKFAYYGNNELSFFDNTNINNTVLETALDQEYAGTEKGVITDLDEYIKDRYGVLTLYECRMLDSTKLFNDNAENYFTQSDTSVYIHYDNQKKAYCTEGNCVLVATHNALTYLRIKGVLKNILLYKAFKATIIPTYDSFYEQAKKNSYIPHTIQTSTLYYDIRSFAIDDYGYTVSNSKLPDGSYNNKQITADNTPSFISKVVNRYGQTIAANVNTAKMTEFTSHIGKDYPSILYLYDDPVYKGHAVVVTGYSIYKKYTTILGIKTCTKTVNTIRIMNGQTKDAIFYDVSASNSLGHIVRFDNN